SLTINPGAGTFRLKGTFRMTSFADQAACAALIELSRRVAGLVRASFGRAHDRADLELADAHRDEPLFTPERIDDVTWLTLWGPELVERAGRERVLATPAHRVEELPYGGVLLLLRPTPIDFATAEARRAQVTALAHLVPERSAKELEAILLERSRKLAPAET